MRKQNLSEISSQTRWELYKSLYGPMSKDNFVGGSSDLKRIMDKSDNERYQIERKKYNGMDYIDIRLFFKDNGEWLPSKKGITIPLDKVSELKDKIVELI